MLKKILIGIGIIIALLIGLLVLGTKGAIFNSGVPLAEVTLSTTKVVGFPVYPAAQATTDTKGLSIPDDLRRVIGTKDARWNRYLTDASVDVVTKWYQSAVKKSGPGELIARSDEGVYIVAKGNTRWGLYVSAPGGTTSIVIASGQE